MNGALAAWNPWWEEGTVPAALVGRPRRLTDRLVAELDAPEVTTLTGIRRSGKTTIMLQLVDALLRRGVAPPAILFANLEDPGLDALSLEHIMDAFPGEPGARRYLLLDEVQARPGWERWIRARYDQKAPLKVVVSGSSSELTRGDDARLLTGRNLTHAVRPLDFAEYLTFLRERTESEGVVLRDHYLPRGGFPEPALRDPHEARSLLEQYFMDILHRDLVARRRLDPERVTRLATYLAQALGGPHTKRRVAAATHLAPDTLRAYLEAMQDAFLIQVVPRFTDSPKPSRETEAPFKVYWADTGLRNAVVQEPERDRGTQAENLVAATLAARGPRPFYWTDGAGRHEVDFLVPRPKGVLDAYQVWYAPGVQRDDPPSRELDAFSALHDAIPRKRHGRCILVTADMEGRRGGVETVRLHDWLRADGA